MIIRKTETSEYSKLVKFYTDMIEEMSRIDRAIGWIMGVYPTSESLCDQIKQGNCYVAIDEDKFIAAMILNTEYIKDYDNAKWSIDAKSKEFAIIHLLGVMPEYYRKGVASQMVKFAISDSKSKAMKAIRLDVIEGNSPAAKLYEKLGFRYIQDLSLYYDSCGLVKFMLYEYAL